MDSSNLVTDHTLEMRKVIITGANGFLGSEVARQLAEKGISVYAVVKNKSTDIRSIEKQNNIEIVYCALDELYTLAERINPAGIDAFYHFAWAGTSGVDRKNYPLQMMNVKWTGDAVKTAALLGCKKFIFASSIMTYETEKTIRAEHTPNIYHIYSVAKRAAENIGMILAGENDLEYISAVISNVYGEGEISERLINSTIRKLLNHEETMFSSCEQLYDFIYIKDAGRAFVELGKRGKANRRYYVGNGKPQKLRYYLENVRDVVDPEQKLGFGKLSTSEISLQYNEFDMGLLHKDTGFVPAVSFEEGIRNTFGWLTRNGE